jgi:hypothetical protein
MAQMDRFKISALTWDSDKDPAGFFQWMETMSSLVRATENGPPLEQMLDAKLHRKQSRTEMIPSFLLEDPDFAISGSAPAEMGQADTDQSEDTVGDNRSGVSRGSGVDDTFSLGRSAVSYAELSDEVKNLDALLYNVVRMNVKGSRNSLLSCVTFPSYVQAVCVLARHMDISKIDRIMRAFSGWDKLTYQGDVMKFQVEVMTLKRELDRSGANLTHYLMSKVMRAFDGKSKTIQFKIAEDLRNHKIDDTLNIYDLIQKYCSEIASVGDGNPARVNSIDENKTEIICHHCGQAGHKRPQCPARIKEMKNEQAKEIICHHCKQPGHKRPSCPLRSQPAVNLIDTVSTSAADSITSAGSENNQSAQQPLTPDAIQLLVQQLRSSPVNMIQSTCNAVNSGARTAGSGESIILSLCDGMGCGALALKQVNASITRYIAVENSETSRIICDNVNPAEYDFPGVDHSWHSDVFNITEQSVRELGAGNIKQVLCGAPCQDMSSLRLLPTKHKNIPRTRPGLNGKHGRVFSQCLLVLSWVLKYNPGCEYFFENVVFYDMEADWNAVCSVLGQPIIIDAADHSYTRRVRAYWTNFANLPSEKAQLTLDFPPSVEADMLMDPGRTIERTMIKGKSVVRTIGASWSGNPDNPVADTTVPIIVRDEMHDKAQHLRPHEAEALMAMTPGITAGCGVNARDRLRAVGNGWDMNVAVMLFRFSDVARCGIRHQNPMNTTVQTCATVPLFQLSADTSAEGPMTEETLQRYLSEYRSMHGESKLGSLLATHDLQTQLLSLKLLHEYDKRNLLLNVNTFDGSVLDSGSGRHIHPSTRVTNKDDRISLTGFNNTSSWTDGNGYLPISLYDMKNDSSVKIDVTDTDLMKSVACPVLSMGKLLRKGYQFYFEGPERCYCVSPSGHQKFSVVLGSDDILRLPHIVRSGVDAEPLPVPQSQVMVAHRTLDQANGAALHQILNHCSMEKVYQTLRVTTGFVPKRFPECQCNACAAAKAVRKGLAQSRPTSTFSAPAASPGTSLLPPAASLCIHPVSAQHTVSAAFEEAPITNRPDYTDGYEAEPTDVDSLQEIEYAAPVAGRALGQTAVPRFDVAKLRPFEVFFVDNKDYSVPVRGGRQTSLVMYDMASTGKFKVDEESKSENGKAFSKLVILNGIHKLPYACTVYSDGCGSMALVEKAAVRLGINHAYIPPHEQSLNEAEKVCNFMWAAARAHLWTSQAPPVLEAEAVSYAMYVDMRMATTASRGWKTPLEIIKGVKPSLLKLHRFYTMAFVAVPKGKRTTVVSQGSIVRAEEGRLLGFQSPYSTTYRVLLTGNRLIHSMNVTFDDSNYVQGMSTLGKSAPDEVGLFPFNMGGSAAPGGRAAGGQIDHSPHSHTDTETPLSASRLPPAYVNIEPCDLFDQSPVALPEYFDPNDDAWKTFSEEAQQRPRPNYAHMFLTQIEEAEFMPGAKAVDHIFSVTQAFNSLCKNTDVSTLMQASRHLAMVAQKDLNWKQVLSGPDRDSAVAAFQAERDSLLDCILIPIEPGHPEYQTALAEHCTGRYLLDQKRNGRWKARGVKQGFKENKELTDGADFVYYSHVAKLVTIRTSLFRPNRGTRRVAIKDVCVAFLQADLFPETTVKYVSFKNPVTGEREYYRQMGPLYGECSAPIRWEDTCAGHLISEGFERGQNEQSVFMHDERDLLILTYVDDMFQDGEEDAISWGSDLLDERFECKDTEWLVPNSEPLDFLGMSLSMDDDRIHLSMSAYILDTLAVLNITDIKVAETPIVKPIDSESPPLSPADHRKFMTGVGCLGWLVNTGRPDVAYAHSRVAQHMAAPNQSALATLFRIFAYLKGTHNWTLSSPLNNANADLSHKSMFDQESQDHGWEFYTDSDFAGNQEVQNKRRSQNGFIALLNGTPVLWGSKVSSVAFAHPDINESHADISSGAAEVYAAANATFEFLHLSYVASEMRIPFPKPFKLQMDNTAAECFAKNSVFKSRLKHIDCRQKWVQTLRDKTICTPTHVDTNENLADIFTKILPTADFVRLRNRIMFNPN